ncbi:trafficking protein particle complex subunit 8-like [Actinia tenebrosa]|uniref:Trafficking protein particle complex subunit 8-like n=1 Tax=Actinia tenebrosa TaxID=6105 RepID=A0A6P8I7Z7_ACTTE|nr:trafficking protein particle complex subunit 8-like [Actinia tenebrosa]
MAVCSQSPADFLQGVFCPTIAVTCSEDAEQVCMKNKLSFVEMTRPFCQLTTEAHIRDPSGAVHTVKNWKLRLLEMSAPHPPHHVVNKLLHEVVARTQPVNTEPSSYSPEYQAKASTPWFEAYRDCFLQLLKPSDHEFIRHFLSCVFVVSSHHSDPMNAFATMTSQLLDQQQTSPNSHIKWFSTGVFRYYVLLHDVNDAVESKAEAIYQSMKSVYGLYACHMLMVNSVNPVTAAQMPNLPDPWSQFIIPASSESLDWDDEVNSSIEATEEDPINCAVDENFDPEKAIADSEEQKGRSGSGSGILIGPLTLDDNHEEPDTQDLINDQSMKSSAELSNSHEKRHLAGQYRYFSSRKFTSAVRSQPLHRTHGLCLSLSDQDRIKIFIHELAFRGLLPYIERMMKNLYDQIMARKGIHRSIFSATKKWFGGGKPAGLASGLVPGIIYANDSPELYHRKLGDLAFLVQNYELAYNCYHTAKRDFNSEHAWFYFAGALEMAAISAFLAGLQRPYPSHYMDTAISTYLTACRQHMFAVRASLLSTDVLKAKNMSLDAAMQFMKMTGEESDLLCALFLEQSAHCFLHCNPIMVRKYAFNMILAGHRFSKSAQRKHALRCYRQALHVYEDKSWHLAEDHINFTLGRQSFNLRQLDDALKSFRQLLVYESQQSPQQQAAYLREFLFVFKQLLEAKDKTKDKTRTLPYLPLPVVDSNATRAILSYNPNSQENTCTNSNPSTPKDQDSFGLSLFGENEHKNNPDNVILIGQASFEEKYDMELEKRWEDMEEELYESVNITPVPPFFRTHVHCLSSKTNNKMKPLCVINETVAIEVVFYNPLKIPLNLTNLMLLWEFTPQDKDSSVVNEFESHENLVETEIISKFAIQGGEKEAARLTLTPCCTGTLHIKGVKYSLSSIAIGGPVEDSFNTTEAHPAVSAVSMLGRLDLNVLGPRLNHTKAEKTSIIHGQDHRLNMVVVPAMPLLEVRFRNFPTNLLCGEVVRTTAEFTNTGQCSLTKLFMASTTPEFFTIGIPNSEKDSRGIYQMFSSEHSTLDNPLSEVRRISEVPIPGGCLAPGVSAKLPVWVQGGEEGGSHSRELKFYYESTEKNPKMSHRALQHAFSVDFSSSLVVRATARRSKYCRNLQEKSDTKEQLIVALDIENLMQGATANKFGEFSVIQVSCVSKRWRLQPLSHHKTDGLLCVRPGETIVTQFKATKYTDKEGNSLGFSHVAFSDEMINTSVTPAVDFFFRSHTWREMYESNSSNNSRTVDTTKVDLGLIVFWKASFIDEKFIKKTVMGQSHVAISRLAESVSASQPVLQTVGAPAALPSSNTKHDKELLIQYLLNHESTIRQDFKLNRLIIVPIELTLKNCCQEVVNVFVERSASETPSSVVTQSTGEPVSPMLEVDSGYRPSTTSFVLIGQTSRRLRLEPNSTSILKFNAMISLPGVYNLNQLRVYAAVQENNHQDEDFDLSKMVLQKPSPPSFLEVEDISPVFVGPSDQQNSSPYLDNS